MRPDLPNRLRPPRFYYGWVIVATMAVVTMAQTAEFNPVLGVFLKPMTAEFGWSRAEFAGAITVGTIVGGFVAVGIGPLLDRFGPRWILTVAFALLGATIVGMAAVGVLWHFYALMAAGRALVSGVIAITTGVVISKWFIRKRGRAMALSTTGTRFGNALMPLYVQLVLGAFGWRMAAVALGGFTWALTIIPTALFLRRQPEDMGLHPDGDATPVSGVVDQAGISDGGSFTVREAARTKAFYIILITTSAIYFTGAGVNFNLFPHLTDAGISPTAAVTVLTVWSILSSIGGLAAGFVAERGHVRLVMVVTFLLVAVGVGLLSITKDLTTAYLFAIVHGITFGGVPILQQLVWADYFGRRHQGAIRGAITPVQMTSNALAPLVTNLVYGVTGSYAPVFAVFILVYVLAAGAMVLAIPPRRSLYDVPVRP
ncbi:MAG: MFS transporter [Chloroflexi bacterium]|nr:MFS transporter [Chloroflexota bacterium]